MHLNKTSLTASLTFALALHGQTALASTYEYLLTDLGSTATQINPYNAYGVNIHGEVTGSAAGGSGGDTGFYWDDGYLANLGDVPGGASFIHGRDINNHGQVVGYGGSDTGWDAFVWAEGVLTTLPDLNEPLEYTTTHAAAQGINDAGQIVGQSGAYPVIWQNGQVSRLSSLPGGSLLGDAYDINDNGQVTGRLSGPDGGHGVIWDGENVINMSATEDSIGLTSGRAINNSGQVAGVGSFNNRNFAMVWDDGAVTQVASPDDGYTQSWALGINDSAQVVGYGNYRETSTYFPARAFIWDATNGSRLLNDLVDPSHGWSFGLAHDISDQGHIVGWASDTEGRTRGYLLTPNPEFANTMPAPVPLPAGLPLLLGGLASFAMLRRRKAA